MITLLLAPACRLVHWCLGWCWPHCDDFEATRLSDGTVLWVRLKCKKCGRVHEC